jgi:hypothetical protein
MILLTGTSRLPMISPPSYFPIKFCIVFIWESERAGPLAEISVEFAVIIGIGAGWKISHMNTPARDEVKQSY